MTSRRTIRVLLSTSALTGLALLGPLVACSAKKSSGCPAGQGACTQGSQCETMCDNGCCVLSHICHANADCPQAKPVCDTGSGACVECLADGDCGSGKRCLANQCEAATACITNADCTGTDHACDPSSNTCVECLQDSDCPYLFTVCEDKACVQTPSCTSSNDCPSDAPYCNTFTDRCGACYSDSQCPSTPAFEACYDGYCTVGEGCEADSDCKGGNACGLVTAGSESGFQLLCVQGQDAGLGGGAACSPTAQENCRSGLCGSLGTNDGMCLDGCRSYADCAPGAQCPPDGYALADLAGPDGVAGTHDDVVGTAKVCFPMACTSDGECADAGFDGAPRVCGLIPGTLTNTSIEGHVLTWVEGCVAPDGTQAGATVCADDDDCASGKCVIGPDAGIGECFGACATAADCADGGTCVPTSFKDESGSFLTSCLE